MEGKTHLEVQSGGSDLFIWVKIRLLLEAASPLSPYLFPALSEGQGLVSGGEK